MEDFPALYTSRMRDEELCDLMLYLIRSETVFQRAKMMLDPDCFDATTESHFLLLWLVLLELSEKFNVYPVPKRSLRHAIARRMEDDPYLVSDEMRDAMLGIEGDEENKGFIEWVYSVEEDSLDNQEGFSLLQSFLEERLIVDRVRDTIGGDPRRLPSKFYEFLESASQKAAQIRVINADPVVEAIPGDWDGMQVGYYTTGIDFLDELLAGGHAPGETVGFMAPYGVGKTLLAVQIGVESAKYLQSVTKQEEDLKHVFLVTYEEAARTIQQRVLSYAADIHLSRLQSLRSFSELSRKGKLLPYERRFFREFRGVKDLSNQDGEYERLQTARQLINKNLHILDFSGSNNCGYGFVDEIVAVLQRLRNEKGWQPGCVLVDFVGRAVERHLAHKNMDASQHMRLMIRRFMDQCRTRVAESFHTPVWLLHQFAGAVVDSNPTKSLSHTDAAECKSFGESLWFSLTLGNIDAKTQVGQMRCSKARRGGTTDKVILVKREGEFARFRDARQSFVIDAMTGKIMPRSIAESLGQANEVEFVSPRTNKAAQTLGEGYAPFFTPDVS